jgi:hypothetical protein
MNAIERIADAGLALSLLTLRVAASQGPWQVPGEDGARGFECDERNLARAQFRLLVEAARARRRSATIHVARCTGEASARGGAAPRLCAAEAALDEPAECLRIDARAVVGDAETKAAQAV